MIALLKNTPDWHNVEPTNPDSMRKETLILTAQNNVVGPITFKKGETLFFIETTLPGRNFLYVTLGGIEKEGINSNFWSRNTEREFLINEYQWLIIKADFLQNEETLNITLKFR